MREGTKTGRLSGKVALITGAARGLGRSHAIRLAQEGADIIVVDVCAGFTGLAYPAATAEDLETTICAVRDIGRKAIGHRADVRDRLELERITQEVFDDFGRVDIVVANAGIYPFGKKFWEISERQWEETLGVNLTGVWNTASAVAPAMIERNIAGSIIAISSINGLKGGAEFADYISSKHGLVGLVRAMANDLAEYRIRVNAICPTSVNTTMINNEAMFRFFRPDLRQPNREDTLDLSRAMHLLPEPWIEAEDVSYAVAWLASDEARSITGIALPVDLGSTAKF